MSNYMKISEILVTYETDKAKGHNYGESYDEIFSWFHKNAPLDILEIGAQKGGSLMAWKDYFFNAKVTGIDIVDVRMEEYKNRKDITFILKDIKQFVPDKQYDIVIDDGSHFFEDVEHAVKTLLPNLRVGGVMIIEDVQVPEAWVHNIRRLINRNEFTLSVRDMRGIQGNYDDFLIIIKKQ